MTSINLLDFARGPALEAAIVVFVFGVFWRLARLFFLPHSFKPSRARPGATIMAGSVREFFRRMKINRVYMSRTMFSVVNGWVFHVGLALVVFGLGAHIMVFKKLIGLSWPNLPSNVIFLVAVVTLASLLAALVHRFTSPVLGLISTADDYFTWLVTVTPVITGLMATMHLVQPYETMLAIHILSVDVLLIWFPFGKLMHAFLAFITRGEMGAQLARRGVKL
jgi:nitrate reductase gamma subunit